MTSDICETMRAIKRFLFCVLSSSLFQFCFNLGKKNDTKKLDSDVSIVSSNDGSVVPAKKRLRLGKIKNVKIFLLEKDFQFAKFKESKT